MPYRHGLACAVLLAAALVMFGDVLAAGTSRVLSIAGEDTTRPFFYWAPFGFGELRRGHLVLWNSYTYAGTPHFGGFGPALLYPPNWLHMVLPTAVAINVIVTLHLVLAGCFVYAWMAHRRLHPAACLFAGLVFMFCGAHFYQIYRGHLHCLTTLVWAPLIFLAIDGVLDDADASWRWPLLGMLGVAMQVLAGHVQYTFYTGLVAGAYALLGWLPSRRRARDAAALGAIYAGGACLAAVQLLTGLQTAAESHRAKLSYDMASWFAFPPENLLTLVMPEFFGDAVAYWGRGTLTEMCLFIGVAPFVLMLAGIVHGGRRQKRWSLTIAIFVLVLAFGDYTPIFHVLYDHVPGFASFRGTTKFIFLASLFLTVLAAVGLDRLLAERSIAVWLGPVAFLVGAALFSYGTDLGGDCARGAHGAWPDLLRTPIGGDGYQSFVVEQQPEESVAACTHAASSLRVAGGTFAAVGVVALASLGAPRLAYAVAVIGVLELVSYDRYTRSTFDPRPLPERSAKLRAALDAQHAGDARIASSDPYSYVAMGARAFDIWGAEPTVLDRYTRFVALTQQWPLDALMVRAGFRQSSPLLGWLRLRYWLHIDEHENLSLEPTRLPELPHALLVPTWRVIADDSALLDALPSLDPRHEALLETDPGSMPSGTAVADAGTASITDVSTDVLEVRAETTRAAILVITDNYSASWKAEPWDAGDDRTYRVVPADYLLRGIPLGPGTHHIRVYYRPSLLAWSAGVSALSLVAYGAAVVIAFGRRRR